jgi:hypothetical protein
MGNGGDIGQTVRITYYEVINLVKTFISSKGIKVKVFIPDLTEEEKRKRDREIERSLISIYKRNENARKYFVSSILEGEEKESNI